MFLFSMKKFCIGVCDLVDELQSPNLKIKDLSLNGNWDV